MARAVTVNEGYGNIAMPNGQLANEGDTVILTDEEFGRLNSNLIGTQLTDEGPSDDVDLGEIHDNDDESGGEGSLDDMTHDELDQKAEDEGVEDYRVSDNKDEKVKALRDGGVEDDNQSA